MLLIKKALTAYLRSTGLPLVITVIATILSSTVMVWIFKKGPLVNATHYDFSQNPSLLDSSASLFPSGWLSIVVLVGMATAAIYQFVHKLYLKGIINTVLVIIVALPVFFAPFIVFDLLISCNNPLFCLLPTSDENALRHEFNLPRDVKLVNLQSPTGYSLFGREGLTIDATFRFASQHQLQQYITEQVHLVKAWKPLPVPRDLLWHIGNISGSVEREIEQKKRTDELIQQHKPDYLITDFPVKTEEERFKQFLKQFPPFPERGYYSCRTAGSNVLYATKTTCENPDRVNDFILGTLDTDNHELTIKVRAYY